MSDHESRRPARLLDWRVLEEGRRVVVVSSVHSKHAILIRQCVIGSNVRKDEPAMRDATWRSNKSTEDEKRAKIHQAQADYSTSK